MTRTRFHVATLTVLLLVPFQLVSPNLPQTAHAGDVGTYGTDHWAGKVGTTLVAASLSAQAPSELELGVLAETNLARTDPAAYADHLEPMLSWFTGDVMYRPGSSVGIRTGEGRAAIREAIRFLRRLRPMPPLEWSSGLWRAARDHARDHGATGRTGHEGSDGSTMLERMSRYGRWRIAAAENLYFGSADPREVVISLVVDDGVPERGHRTNVFDPSLRVAGVGCGPHPEYGSVCVIDYAGRYDGAGHPRR